MSKCSTNAMIHQVAELKRLGVRPDIDKDAHGRFSQDLSKDLAANLLKNAGKIGLDGEHDLAVILDTLIHLLAEGRIAKKG